MRRLQAWTPEQIMEYNLRDGGTAVTIFAEAQPGRIADARDMLGAIVDRYPGKRLNILEPGCSSGDITGPFSEQHDVWGCDVVPAAVAATKRLWPQMAVIQEKAENVTPTPCDILVLCEFLEHIDDPMGFVANWMPLAKNVIISHPLVRDGLDPERGHIWAYYMPDFWNWWPEGGHRMTAWSGANDAYQTILGMGERL